MCSGHLKDAGVEDDHDETGDVERAKRGVDDKLGVVETTEVYLYRDDLVKTSMIMTRMMREIMRTRRRMMTSSTKP